MRRRIVSPISDFGIGQEPADPRRIEKVKPGPHVVTGPRPVVGLGFAVVAALAAVACGADGPASSGTSVRDSAGIQIVENRGAPDWGGAAAWRVADTPAVDIGVLEGPPEYSLYRANAALRLDDGRIVVANGGTGELRFYDAAGRFLRAVGRKGEGPGEFEGMNNLYLFAGDSLAVWDGNAGRLSIFTVEGAFARMVRPTRLHAFVPRLVGVFRDHSFLVNPGFDPGAIFAAGGGFRRDTTTYLHFSAAGELLDSLRLPGAERFVLVRGLGFSTRLVPWGADGFIAVRGDRLYFADTERYEIDVRDAAGRLLRRIRREVEPRPVTAEMIDRYERDELEGVDEDRRATTQRLLDEMPYPETMSAFAGLFVDDLGDIWVREHESPDAERRTWTVFDATGALLGPVRLPPGLTPLQIGPDFLLGRWRDELDIEHIRLYELIKPARAG